MDDQGNTTRYLRSALLGNAAFSFTTGATMVLATSWVASIIGSVPNVLISLVGWMLVLFSVSLLLVAIASTVNPILASTACLLDLSWCIATPICWLVFRTHFSTTGLLLTLAIAMVVGLFAWLQAKGLRLATLNAQA